MPSRDPTVLPEHFTSFGALLRLIADGRSNAEMAESLIVALSTVKWHVSNLYGKLW